MEENLLLRTVSALEQNGVLGMTPEDAQSKAIEAVKWVGEIIKKRPDKLVIKGKQYIELQDWEFIGLYFKVYARTDSTEFIRENDNIIGVQATCSTYNRDGDKLSTAIMICTKKEPQFKDKPINQLSAMAQTRGCRRAFIQTLRWVFDISGADKYEPEEEPADVVIEQQEDLFSEELKPSIDMVWLRETLQEMKEDDPVSYKKMGDWLKKEADGRQYKTWSEYVTNLPPERAKFFVEMVQEARG